MRPGSRWVAPAGVETVPFDFEDPDTFAAALDGIDKIFLMRPPAISDASLFGALFLQARASGVKQVVFMSLLGAEKNKLVPHRGIEDRLKASGLGWTFLRPSFFMQNLSTTHAPEIRDENQILVPSGQGRTSFIDGRDIAAVAVKTLTDDGHLFKAYDLTGSEALRYRDVAAILSRELGRTIRYDSPGLLRFCLHMRKRKFPWAQIAVMGAIYTVVRLGQAGTVSPVLQQLLGRPPITLAQFAKDYRQTWIPA